MTHGGEVRIRVGGIITLGGRMLLVSHQKEGDVYWLVPGGGVKCGESLEEALAREFREELNVEISVERPALMCDSIDPEGSRHIINIFFHCSRLSGEFFIGSDPRLRDFSFFKADELGALTIFPPINRELAAVMGGGVDNMYLGKKWKKNR